MKTAHFKPGNELTFKSVVEIRSRLYNALIDEKIGRLRLDLSEVTLCDSAGMALLIEARKLCKKNNKSLEIIGMSAETQSLADFCGVKDILEVV